MDVVQTMLLRLRAFSDHFWQIHGQRAQMGPTDGPWHGEQQPIKVGQDQIDAKAYELGITVEKLAEFEEGLEVPEEFLAVLKEERCLGMDAECEEPQQTRQAQMRHTPKLWQF